MSGIVPLPEIVAVEDVDAMLGMAVQLRRAVSPHKWVDELREAAETEALENLGV